MSTTYATPGGSGNQPNYNDKKSNSNAKTLLAVAGAIILLLLGTNIALWVSRISPKDHNATVSKLEESEKLKIELEKQYTEATMQLEEMKGTNDELNSLIEKQKEELGTQRAKIDDLIQNKKDLSGARRELDNLRGQIASFQAKIAELEGKNADLTNQVGTLASERDELTNSLTGERTAKEQALSERDAVSMERNKIDEERQMLSKKVNIASVVKVGSITGQGFEIKKSGKEVDKRFAKNVERIKICFQATDNKVVDGGTETFYIRIITPLGETLTTGQGSGVLTNQASGEQVPYTQVKDIQYSNDATDVCLVWDPGMEIKKGNYDVEIYNKGYLAGKGSFQLK